MQEKRKIYLYTKWTPVLIYVFIVYKLGLFLSEATAGLLKPPEAAVI